MRMAEADRLLKHNVKADVKILVVWAIKRASLQAFKIPGLIEFGGGERCVEADFQRLMKLIGNRWRLPL